MSSMKATLEQMAQPIQKGNSESLSLMEHNLRRGKFSVHVKRRNGRVRMMVEEIYVENSSINFAPFSTADEVAAQSLVPKAMAKPFRYMMVENLSVRAKLTLNTLLLRKRVLAGGRLSISVIQMMRCPTQMRILMMTWIYDSRFLY